MKLNGIERETFLEHFTFDFENGKVYWKKGRGNIVAGTLAGSVTSHGYVSVRFDGKSIYLHRLLYWMYHQIDIEDKDIDHRNRIKSDNKIKNLRSCSRGENCRNLSSDSYSNTRFRNISITGLGDPTKITYYHANMQKHAKNIFSKCFPYTPEGLEQAKIAVLNARKKHFGEYSGDN